MFHWITGTRNLGNYVRTPLIASKEVIRPRTQPGPSGFAKLSADGAQSLLVADHQGDEKNQASLPLTATTAIPLVTSGAVRALDPVPSQFIQN